jgi:hypothetical protein
MRSGRSSRGVPVGLTWAELKERLDLPCRQPCPEWLKRMENEGGLLRARGTGRAYVWQLSPDQRPGDPERVGDGNQAS